MFNTRTEQTTVTTGTGTVDLIAALTGRRNFADTIGNGNQCYYIIQTADEAQWEEGWGTVTAGSPDQLSRTAVVRSSNNNNLVNFPAGTKTVFIGDNADTIRFGSVGQLPTSAGTATALTVAYAPAVRHIKTGMIFAFIAGATATGNATTLSINGLSALPLKEAGGVNDPTINYGFVAGSLVIVVADATGFRILSGGPNVTSRVYVDTAVTNLSNNVAAELALRAPKASPIFTGDMQVNGTYRSAIVSPGALDLDCSTGNYFSKTIATNSTFTFSNVPTGAFFFTLKLQLTSGAITWPATVRWPNGVAPSLITGKTHLFTFVTQNNGSTWFASSILNYVG